MKVSSLGPFGQTPPAAQLVAKPFVYSMSFARMDTFARGEISGMMKAGMTREDIVKLVKKKDGSSPCLRSVGNVMSKCKEDPAWRGTDSVAGGRPRALTPQEEKEVEKLVFKERGRATVTVPMCRRRLAFSWKWCMARPTSKTGEHRMDTCLNTANSS